MSLSEAFKKLEESEHLTQCKTCQWYGRLDPDDKAFFDHKVDDPGLNYRRLLRACKLSGLTVAPSSFHNHLTTHHDGVRVR